MEYIKKSVFNYSKNGAYMNRLILLVVCFFVANYAFAATSWSSGAYGNNQNVKTKLSINGASGLQVSIKGLTEGGYDFVTITDNNGAQVFRSSGVLNSNIVVQGDGIQVQFTSDWSVTFSGVTVEISSLGSSQATVRQIPKIMLSRGWTTAASMMEQWFTRSSSAKVVTMDSILKLSGSTQLKEKLQIISQNASNVQHGEFRNTVEKQLAYELRQKKGSDGKNLLQKTGDFDFISTEIQNVKNEAWAVHEIEKKNRTYIIENTLEYTRGINEYNAAYGTAVLRLVAKGRVDRLSSTSSRITIKEFGVYFKDSYDFVGDQGGVGILLGLGCWNFQKLTVTWDRILSDCTPIDNIHFRNWAASNNLPSNAGNYLIYTDPKEYRIAVDYQFTVQENDPSNSSTSPSLYPEIDRFYYAYQAYFGTKQGSQYSCYTDFICQNFLTGKIIALHKQTRILYWHDGSAWRQANF